MSRIKNLKQHRRPPQYRDNGGNDTPPIEEASRAIESDLAFKQAMFAAGHKMIDPSLVIAGPMAPALKRFSPASHIPVSSALADC